MNIQDMHFRFKLYLDKLATFSYPNLLDNEIDVYLNKAQEELIKVKYGGNNQSRTGVEEVEKRRDDLANITDDYSFNCSAIPTTYQNKPYGIFVPLPSNFMFSLAQEAGITVDECGNTLSGTTIFPEYDSKSDSLIPKFRRVLVKPISHDIYGKIILDPFNKPDSSIVLQLTFQNDSVELITAQGIGISTYYLRYIRLPKEMMYVNSTPGAPNVDCELMDQMHEELLDRAVSLALEGLESQRFQTQSINSLKNE
jgi:hypothetical protein